MNEHKVALVGACGVGKSAISAQFEHGNLLEPTNTAFRKQMAVDDHTVLLDVLDSPGYEEYSAVRERYLRPHQGFLLVYSITSRSSFDEIMYFKEEICRIMDEDHVPMVLVGNKCEMEAERQISAAEGSDLAKSWGIPFFESSALLRTNIDETFSELVRQIRQAQNPRLVAQPTTNKKNHRGAFSTKCLIL